jgi:Zn-dependent peptidase ImmA (M78 family)
MNLYKKFLRLEQYANKLGYKVLPGKYAVCYDKSKVKCIHINYRCSIKNRIFCLAHEIGHALTIASYEQEMGSCLKRSSESQWPVLERELHAWAKADKLLRKLKLYTADYLKYKHACLRTYYRT